MVGAVVYIYNIYIQEYTGIFGLCSMYQFNMFVFFKTVGEMGWNFLMPFL